MCGADNPARSRLDPLESGCRRDRMRHSGKPSMNALKYTSLLDSYAKWRQRGIPFAFRKLSESGRLAMQRAYSPSLRDFLRLRRLRESNQDSVKRPQSQERTLSAKA